MFEENVIISGESAKTGKLSVADKMNLVNLTACWAAVAKTTIADEVFSKIKEVMTPNENHRQHKRMAGENSIKSLKKIGSVPT